MKYVGTRWNNERLQWHGLQPTVYRITKKNDDGTYALYNVTNDGVANQKIGIDTIIRVLTRMGNICTPKKHIKKHRMAT